MKTTRQHLQKLIKEELDAVMKETEEGLEEGYTDEGRKEAEEAFKSARKNRAADEKEAARVKAKEDKAEASKIRKSGALDDMKKGKVEEVLDDRKRNQPFVKGPKGAPDKENDPAAVHWLELQTELLPF